MTSSASRRATDSRWRRTSKITLSAGSVVAAVFAVLSMWVPWVGALGVGIAIIAGAVATWGAWREFLEYRALRNAEATAIAQDHTEHLRKLRTEHGEVMDVLTTRTTALKGELFEARAETGELKSQVSRLRGDNEALRVENAELHTQVTTQEAAISDLRALLPVDENADVFTLPRRRAGESDAVEGWDVAEAQTVIDLDIARLATPFVEDIARRHAN